MTDTELLERAVSRAQQDRDEWFQIAREERSKRAELQLEIERLKPKAEKWDLYQDVIQERIDAGMTEINDDEPVIAERH